MSNIAQKYDCKAINLNMFRKRSKCNMTTETTAHLQHLRDHWLSDVRLEPMKLTTIRKRRVITSNKYHIRKEKNMY